MDGMLNQLMEIGLTDEIEKNMNVDGGEGALSASIKGDRHNLLAHGPVC